MKNDGVFTSFTLELFSSSEIPVVVAESSRVIRPGGRICVVSMSNQGKNGTMEKLYIWSHKRFPEHVDCRPVNAAGYLEEAGFKIAEKQMLSDWGLAVDITLAVKH